FVHYLANSRLMMRIAPAIFQPRRDLTGGSGRRSQLWPPHLEHKVLIAGFSADALLGHCRPVQTGRAALDRAMRREVVKPQAPQLITDLSWNRVAVLIKCFQITKNADDLVSDVLHLGVPDSFG